MGSFKDIIYKEAGMAGMAGAIDDIGKVILKRGPKTILRNAKKVKPDLTTAFKNHDDILKYVSGIVGNDKAKKVMGESIVEGGTGSIFADMGLGLGKKVKPLKPKIEDAVLNMRRGLDNADMKAGNFLGKKNRIFDQKLDINLGKSQDGLSNDIKQLTVKRLTAPMTKTKDAILPMAGAMAISSKMYKEPEKEEGPQYER